MNLRKSSFFKKTSMSFLVIATLFGLNVKADGMKGDLPLGTFTFFNHWSVPLSYDTYNNQFGWGINGPFFSGATNNVADALIVNPDGSPALFLLENMATSVTLAGREIEMFTFDVHQANKPISSPSHGSVGDWDIDTLGEDIGGLIHGDKNYCELFPEAPVSGIWNTLWGSHSASIGIGGTLDEASWGLSLSGATTCDGRHNGHGATVSVGASISTGLGQAMELAELPLPVKISFDIGGSVGLSATVGGGVGGEFKKVPHPIYVLGKRTPEYMYISFTPNAKAKLGGSLTVGMGLEGFISGTLDLISLSLTGRLESGLTRAANPKNWKGYIRTTADFSAGAGGGGINAGIKLGISPFSITIYSMNLVKWDPLIRYSLPLYNDYVKFKVRINVKESDAKVTQVNSI